MNSTGESEAFLASALGARRKNVVIGTKFGFEMGEGKKGASAKYVREAAQARRGSTISLVRLLEGVK